ncbi:hypothetical protein [Mesorhizobium sp. KR9-304]|uniref:antitoxin Xre/MbcA/ParS-like domain-containing protein n=1 Tax=Mesorhizobium sp. KR9-304 TaxID=3156614 RepID=UPI0032B47900
MADERKFSRERHKLKLARREDIERRLYTTIHSVLVEHDPTLYPNAVHLIAELAAVIGSQLASQPQSMQRALLTIKDDIAEFGTEFVSQLTSEAKKDVDKRIRKFEVAAPPPAAGRLHLADEWAGPVAGPTLIERHFGIPRSTLYRWQKLNEVIALDTRSSRKPVFPLKQFIDGRPVQGIADLVEIFRDRRLAWQWLVKSHPAFGGSSPLDALLEGRANAVIEIARGLDQSQKHTE